MRASKSEAHRCVWCSKGATLDRSGAFAAERRRPAPDGRALSCAAPYARKIQGLTASQNLPDARNRAPRTPRFAAHLRCVSAKRILGSKRGQGNHTVPFCPLCLRRQTAAFSPVNTGTPGRRRRPLLHPKTGRFSPPAAHRCIGGKISRLPFFVRGLFKLSLCVRIYLVPAKQTAAAAHQTQDQHHEMHGAGAHRRPELADRTRHGLADGVAAGHQHEACR